MVCNNFWNTGYIAAEYRDLYTIVWMIERNHSKKSKGKPGWQREAVVVSNEHDSYAENQKMQLQKILHILWLYCYYQNT